MKKIGILFSLIFAAFTVQAVDLHLNQLDYFETQGLNVLLYHNAVHGVFFDQKLSGLEIIQHGERIATNGDIRLLPTPEQWDPVAHFKERKRDGDHLIAFCEYPDRGLSYRTDVAAEPGGFRITVNLDKPLPKDLIGKAGFNLEFLPSSFFGKSYVFDETTGIFPRHPDGPMQLDQAGVAEPLPLASGRHAVLSPEDPTTRIDITSDSGPILLFDGRNRAQNGWFVLRTLLPQDKTESALVWHVRPNVIPGWTRPPIVGFNQVGYTPRRSKVAVIELDPLYKAPKSARVLRLGSDGKYVEAFKGEIKPWGKWLRYQYAHFDFSSVREPGIYAIEYGGQLNGPFRIADDVYVDVWHPSLDTYLPEQMDHVLVREGYRVWHGPSHLDDARQAPINHTHFDGYAQGPTTDSPFRPGEHVPGINVGSWYDAGDFDLRTQTIAQTIMDLVMARELFNIDRDQTTVDEKARFVQIRQPDGIPDVAQQIEHGAIGILAQYKVFGHAVPGIIAPTLEQYTHLGDGGSATDRHIYSDKLGKNQIEGDYSGVPDDRWVFTSRATALEYRAIASLAAASRGLKGTNDPLAQECLQTATKAWDEEHKRPPSLFRSFNTTGGDPADEEVRAAIELLLATKGEERYRIRVQELLPVIQQRFVFLGGAAVRALPFMGPDFKSVLAIALRAQKPKLDEMLAKNPYGVPISNATWGGSGAAIGLAFQMYLFHQAFPEIIGPEYTLRGFDYVLGNHPASNVSYVSTVGTRSKLIAYGNNRADYTFIPGGVIPGVLIVQPDFPELKNDWPFLWFENEYVVDGAAAFILTANAADELSR